MMLIQFTVPERIRKSTDKEKLKMKTEKNLVGFKALDKDFKCKAKQYEPNSISEEPKAVPCECGLHFR